MQNLRLWPLALASCLTLMKAGTVIEKPASAPTPVIDKAKLENYLRYAEGFSSNVNMTIDDPTPTLQSGYYRFAVHLSMGTAKQEKVYYLTADGSHVLTGPVWDLKANPFSQTAQQLTMDGPAFGPADAKVTLVIFSDFQCPYCRELARTIRTNLPEKYPRDVKVVFKDFPIDSLHPWARAAAEAAHCIGDGNPQAFWAFHDWIFEHQQEFNPNNLREKTLGFAKEHSLDGQSVASCLDTHGKRGEVEASSNEGHALGIDQTPTFYLNGRAVPGAISWAALNTLIQMELNRPNFIPPAQLKR
jgi:protein-disulfide isomerase